MIKKIILWGLIFLFPLVSFAQKKKQKITGYLKFGSGLYWDISKVVAIYYCGPVVPTVNGQQIWIITT